MITGIYQIRNVVNNKVYVGQARDIGDRWKNHIHQLCHNRHSCEPLQEEWNKYGFKNFQFSVLEQLPSDSERLKDKLDILESKNGAEINATDSSTGYNYISRFKYEKHNEGDIVLDNNTRIQISRELGTDAFAVYCGLLAYYDKGKERILTRTGFLSSETGLKDSTVKRLLKRLEEHYFIEESFPDYARAGLRVFRIIEATEREQDKEIKELKAEIERLKNEHQNCSGKRNTSYLDTDDLY